MVANKLHKLLKWRFWSHIPAYQKPSEYTFPDFPNPITGKLQLGLLIQIWGSSLITPYKIELIKSEKLGISFDFEEKISRSVYKIIWISILEIVY